MASARMHEALNGAWQVAEARSRKYARGSFRALPVEPEAQAVMDRVSEAQRFANDHTDRQVAAAYPDVVQKAVTFGWWEKIKP